MSTHETTGPRRERHGRAGTTPANIARGTIWLVAICVVFVAVPPLALGNDSQPTDCSECHVCPKPTADNPCLKPGTCPRHAAMVGLDPAMGPDVVILDGLVNLYGPVRFNHKGHSQMVKLDEGCETCHHYTPPNSPHPGCQECHPVDIVYEDIAQPGLKGAYHRSCLACHQDWDNDTACEICHAKLSPGQTASVPDVHKSYEVIELSELIIFDTEYEEGDQVPFHHRNHSVLYERDCSECHQHQSCTRCHVQESELHPMGALADIDLHDTCFQCHHEERCADCHGRDPDDLFDHASTGWPLADFHSGLRCRSCHGQRGPFMKLVADCKFCHPTGWCPDPFDHRITGVALDEVHGELECADCHGDCVGTPSDCTACHDDERKYNRSTGFGS